MFARKARGLIVERMTVAPLGKLHFGRAPGVICTILHFLHNLGMGLVSQSVKFNQDEKAFREKHSNLLCLFIGYKENEVLLMHSQTFLQKLITIVKSFIAQTPSAEVATHNNRYS
jgi:hypothetical protein